MGGRGLGWGQGLGARLTRPKDFEGKRGVTGEARLGLGGGVMRAEAGLDFREPGRGEQGRGFRAMGGVSAGPG